MKIAVFSDVHGNLPAFKAVINDFPKEASCICCGDIVGYYPDAEEVCDILRETNVLIVRGNHDAYVVGELIPSADKVDAYKTKMTQEILSNKNLSWLADLPKEEDLIFDGIKISIRHASPWDEETYIYPDSSRISEINLNENEFLFLGHTHRPMWVKAGDGMILNPGSVGQPRDWNPLASYALFDTSTKTVEIKRVEYDVKSFQNRLRLLRYENELIEILGRKKDTDK